MHDCVSITIVKVGTSDPTQRSQSLHFLKYVQSYGVVSISAQSLHWCSFASANKFDMAPAFSELLSEAKATKKYLDSTKRCKTKREASLERLNHLIKLISECNMSANQAGDLVMEVQKINWSAKLKLKKTE